MVALVTKEKVVCYGGSMERVLKGGVSQGSLKHTKPIQILGVATNEPTLPLLTTSAWAQSLVYWAAWQAVHKNDDVARKFKILTDNLIG